MEEIVKIRLDNEMDLILAHKRTMKLAELCGLSISFQTTFATAVSEISRSAISSGKNSSLVLSINFLRLNKKEIVASVFDDIDLYKANGESISYAKKLMGGLEGIKNENGIFEIRISQHIAFSGTITSAKIESFKTYFKQEPPLSPYDEIRKKNILLIELADKLKESENQYRLLTDTLPLMIFAINPAGEINYSNRWFNEYLKIQDQATRIPWKSWAHPDDYKILSDEWEKAQSQKTTLRLQARLKHINKQEYLWHLVTIVPVKNDNAVYTSWIGFFVDINAQKLVEETLKDNKELILVQQELKDQQAILEEKIQELNISNKNLEQFAYIASHDLQEPLRKIMTFSSRIEKSQILDEKNKFYFDRINASTMYMSTLIKDVLNYSRSTHADDNHETIDMNELMQCISEDFDLLIQEQQAIVKWEKLPVIKGIPLQVTQLFSNLLSNSLKFSKGSPVITIKDTFLEKADHVKGLDTSKSYHVITFADNGIGFEPEYKDRIFNIFQRLNDRRNYQGTGIGLALCKKVMDNHSGFITAESELNEGATFSMYFPVEAE